MKHLLPLIGLSLMTTPLFASDETVADQIIKIDEVVVTASKMDLPLKNVPQKVELISASDIKAIPGENIGDILKRTTNIDILEYPGATTTIGMRGFPATAHSRSYVLVLIDGIPSGTNNLATIPADIVERIEVVKGPYSVLYGSDAMGGVINIITKPMSKKPTGSVNLSMGSFGQSHFSAYAASGIGEKLNLSLGYSKKTQAKDYRIGSNNIFDLNDSQEDILDKKSYGDIMTNTQYDINQLNGKLQYNINDTWKATLFSNLVVSDDIETPGNYWHSYGMSKKDINRFYNNLEIARKTDRSELVITPYLSHQKESNYNSNTDSSFITSREEIRQMGVKAYHTYKWEQLKWMVGVDYDLYDVSSRKYSSKFTESNPNRPDHTRNSISPFTQLLYTWGNLHANAGLRYNHIAYKLEKNEFLGNEAKTEIYDGVNPSVGLKYFVLPNLGLHASAGTAFYSPDTYKTAGIYQIGKKIYVGNKDLKPERVTSFDLGVNYEFGDLLQADLTYFHNFYDNKVVTDNSRKDTTSYKNALSGVMNGIEVLFSSNISSLWTDAYDIRLFGGATFNLNTKFKDQAKDSEGNAVVVKKDILYVRKTTGNFGLSFNNRQGFDTRLTARYIGHRLENDYMTTLRPNITAADYHTGGGYTAADKVLKHGNYMVFDLSAAYTFKQNYRIGVSANNILDENYSEKDGYNMPGRSIMGHFTYSF